MEAHDPSSAGGALSPAALRAALTLHRPVFGNPWDRTTDMFACFAAVTMLIPFLLWIGGELMSAIFGFDARWHLGVFMAAALVGAATFMTIVGRERTGLTVDIIVITAWLLLGLVVAPLIGLAPPVGVALVLYGVVLLANLVYVVGFGQWETAFIRTLSWPVTWSLMALLYAFLAYKLILFQS
jgi:hypothetical protein